MVLPPMKQPKGDVNLEVSLYFEPVTGFLSLCDCCAKRQELYDLVASLSPLRISTLKTVHFLVTMKILHSGAVTNLYIYIIIYTHAVTDKISGRLKYIVGSGLGMFKFV